MANVKERYTQVTRDARSGRFEPVQKKRASSAPVHDKDIAEERRLAAMFRKRARDDYEAAPSKG
jgi:hypothetical protein